jgi:hypothetical protein
LLGDAKSCLGGIIPACSVERSEITLSRVSRDYALRLIRVTLGLIGAGNPLQKFIVPGL